MDYNANDLNSQMEENLKKSRIMDGGIINKLAESGRKGLNMLNSYNQQNPINNFNVYAQQNQMNNLNEKIEPKKYNKSQRRIEIVKMAYGIIGSSIFYIDNNIYILEIIEKPKYYYYYYKKIRQEDEINVIMQMLIQIHNFPKEYIVDDIFLNKLLKMFKEQNVMTYKCWDSLNNENYINCENGLINLTGVDNNINHPEFTYYIGAKYLRYDYEKKSDFFNIFCQNAFYSNREDRKIFLYEILGYLLSDIRLDKAILIVGEDNITKDFVHIIKTFITEEEINEMPVSEIDKYMKNYDLRKKKLNISYTTQFNKNRKDIFLTLVKSNTLTLHKKNNTTEKVRLRTKFIFVCNDIPKALKSDLKFMNNFIIVNFDNNGNMKCDYQQLEEEKNLIFSQAIDYFIDVLNNDRKFLINDRIQDIFVNSGHVENFVDEVCILGDEYKIHKNTLYEEYVKYCENEDVYNLYEKKEFFRFLQFKYNLEKPTRFHLNGSLDYGFKGIDLKEIMEL